MKRPHRPPVVSKLSDATTYLRKPAVLLSKLHRTLKRRRSLPAYRTRLQAGDLVTQGVTGPSALPITVAMAVFRVSEEHLREAIESVRSQTHTNWKLVIVDDASPDAHVAEVLAAAARDDRRIEVHRRTTNGGIAVSSNELLAAAEHEFVAFLDHDDRLHPRALELVASTLQRAPGTDWLFTDEDKLDSSGRHYAPCFKPGFSRHLLLSFNFVSHLRVVRRAAALGVGGHRDGLEGAQDWDLALRMLATGHRFCHLPGILYHWRSTAGSMAHAAASKPSANRAAARALADFAATVNPGAGGDVELLLAPSSQFRVRMRSAGRDPGDHPQVTSLPGNVATDDDALRRALEATETPLVSTMGPGLPHEATRALVGLLQVPGTAMAWPRRRRGGRVSFSGWEADVHGALHDPLSGLALGDPGYLNLALMPGRRTVPPATGWIARRDDLIAMLDVTTDVESRWRPAVGLLRCGREGVVSPDVTISAPSPQSPPSPCPAELPRNWSSWAHQLGLLP